MHQKFKPAVFIVLLFVSCSYPDTPRVVALKFLTAFQKHDFLQAGKYGTKETVKLLKQIERIEELDKEQLPLPAGEIKIVSEEIEGNKAVVFFKEENGAGDAKEEKLILIKVKTNDEQQWKVNLTKTDLKLPEPLFGPAIPDSLPQSSF
jgi:hypothetical protein